MKKIAEYFRTFARTLNPFSYSRLAERVKRDAFGYFLSTILFATIILAILYGPTYFSLHNNIEDALTNVNRFRVDINIQTNASVNITLPFKFFDTHRITVDTTGSVQPNETNVLVTNEFIYYNFGKNRKEAEEYSDILSYRDNIKAFLFTFLILLAPAILIITFLGYALMYLFFILVISFLELMLINIFNMKKKLKFSELFNMGLYASTFLAFGMLSKAIFPELKLYLYGLFVIYFMLGVIFTSLSIHPKRSKE